MDKAHLISLVIPCFNEQEVFPLLRQRFDSLLAKIPPDYKVEILFIDDGSSDQTWSMIENYARQEKRVRGLSLSRNFGHQRALTCGYDACEGDIIISMDADLQDPPELVLEMLEKWRSGADVVHAVRRAREGETYFKLATAKLFYKIIRRAGGPLIEDNVGDFRLMSRRALQAFNNMREEHRFIRGMVGWMGFQVERVYFDRPKRAAGVTKYPFYKMLKFAVDALVSFSSAPLRAAYLAAVFVSSVVIVYWAYVLFDHFFKGAQLVPGWTSLLLTSTLFGCSNLICLGIMGEYVGRIYDQAKRRPLYLVKHDLRSDREQR
jgi:glycosyltransferase involved in cell wall biosynthesis